MVEILCFYLYSNFYLIFSPLHHLRRDLNQNVLTELQTQHIQIVAQMEDAGNTVAQMVQTIPIVASQHHQ